MEDIRQIPLFESLSEQRAVELARQCAWRTYSPHELVLDYDDDTTDVRFLVSGRVRIIHRIATGKEVILGEIGAGGFFGEIAAIDSEGRSANVTALNKAQMCCMPQSVFMGVIELEPEVSRKVLSVLTQRIRSLNLRLAEHSFLQVKHRLYSELLRLSLPRKGHEGQHSISPPPFQKELADRIGSRREVVSRELSALEKLGVVEKTKGALIIADVSELNRMISDGWLHAD